MQFSLETIALFGSTLFAVGATVYWSRDGDMYQKMAIAKVYQSRKAELEAQGFEFPVST